MKLKNLFMNTKNQSFFKIENKSSFFASNMDHLLNKPYVNGVTLTEKTLSLKCCHSLDQKLCSQSSRDLSKEALWISVGQLAAKL